jgi:hypothetical protein
MWQDRLSSNVVDVVGLPELQCERDLDYVRTMLQLNDTITQEEVLQRFRYTYCTPLQLGFPENNSLSIGSMKLKILSAFCFCSRCDIQLAYWQRINTNGDAPKDLFS